MTRAVRRPRRFAPLALRALAVLFVALGGVLAWTRAHDGPVGPFPGGALRAGVLQAGPFDATRFVGARTLEIETRPSSPWSVTTWFVVRDGVVYASADFLNPGKRWPRFVLEDPRVVVRLRPEDASAAEDGVRIAFRATRVDDPETIAALRDAFARKYALAPTGLAARTQVWFFRMDPREER